MKNRLKKWLIRIFVLILFIFVLLWASELGRFYEVKYEKQDINNILSEGVRNDEYKILSRQTGLSKGEIEKVLAGENPLETLKKFQKQNFSKNEVVCEYMFFPTTKGESLVDENGETVRLEIPELKTGDILVTRSTHTLIFRHGHAGLVTDGDKSEVLEAMMIGTNSDYTNASSWTNFPTLAVLRPKNLSEEEINDVVKFAKENLYDVKYDLFAGLFGDTYEENKVITKTHCSHLVWYAYKSAGIDIDSNGGLLVLPEDFLKSNELELIWSYGINVTK